MWSHPSVASAALERNERAQRFYAKHGFAVTGTKRFRLGGHWEQDYVMVRPA